MRFKSMMAVLVVAAGVLLSAASAQAKGYLNWISKTCVIVDGTFQVCKPSDSWDTQQKTINNEAVRWVLHRSGANPIIKLNYDSDVEGKTAHDYARKVKKDLQLRGISVSRVDNRVINGRNVSLIYGSDNTKLEYLVAVYRDQTKGLRLECTAGQKDFSFFSSEFMGSINSVRFVR